MDPLSNKTKQLFKYNRLAGHYTYVAENEVVPHFFSRGTYFLRREGKQLIGVHNSCLHSGAKLVHERTKIKPGSNITCKLHGWKYNTPGELIECPNFNVSSLKLREIPLVKIGETIASHIDNREVNPIPGLYFEEESIESINKLSDFFLATGIDFDSFQFDQENIAFYHVNWKTIAEMHLNSYNLSHQHPGLGSFIDTDNPISENKNSYNIRHYIQSPNKQIKSLGWQKFRDSIHRVDGAGGWAIFGMIYPGLIFEFYPHVMVINQLVPVSDKMTASYVQVYYDKIATQDFEFQNDFMEAYSETAQERAVLQDFLEEGKLNLPFHNPRYHELESGILGLQHWISKRC